MLEQVKENEVRTYIPEKEQRAVYRNRQRARGEYGKSLLKRRGEFVERSFAHCYETGAMRRCTLRGTKNILKRQLIHAGAFNIGLVLRKMLGAGTPRELKNRALNLILRVFAYLIGLCGAARRLPARKYEVFPLMDGSCVEGFYC